MCLGFRVPVYIKDKIPWIPTAVSLEVALTWFLDSLLKGQRQAVPGLGCRVWGLGSGILRAYGLAVLEPVP